MAPHTQVEPLYPRTLGGAWKAGTKTRVGRWFGSSLSVQFHGMSISKREGPVRHRSRRRTSGYFQRKCFHIFCSRGGEEGLKSLEGGRWMHPPLAHRQECVESWREPLVFSTTRVPAHTEDGGTSLGHNRQRSAITAPVLPTHNAASVSDPDVVTNRDTIPLVERAGKQFSKRKRAHGAHFVVCFAHACRFYRAMEQ